MEELHQVVPHQQVFPTLVTWHALQEQCCKLALLQNQRICASMYRSVEGHLQRQVYGWQPGSAIPYSYSVHKGYIAESGGLEDNERIHSSN